MATGIFIGFLIGFILQRGRFCIVGAYRDIFLSRNFTMSIAILIIISLQSIGVWALFDFNLILIKERTFYWLATIIGGLIFGFGMVIAGGCATGTWYRAGEGLIGSMIALIFYALGAAMTKYGALEFVRSFLRQYHTKDSSFYQSLQISPWILVGLLSSITLFLVIKELNKPKIKIAMPKPKKQGLNHLLFEKYWHPFITALLFGIVAILAWLFSSWSGRHNGIGITTPSANLMSFLVTGDTKYIDWGVFFVIGIFVGAFFGAKLSQEFRFRLPDKRTLALSSIGGFLMGFGASLAGGCTIGNGLVQTAIFSYQGWVATIFFLVGAYIATFIFLIRPQRS